MSQLRPLLALVLLATSLPAWGAIASTAYWNIRTDGATTNGGGFDPGVGSPGTDFSAQASAQIAFTDIVIGGTTSTFTSVAHAATSASPGNFIQITGGSGCTTGFYEVLSQSVGIYTVDRALGTAASTCTGNLGGALTLIQTALTNATPLNVINVKSGTYTFTSTYTLTVTNLYVIGYGTTYDDGGTKPELTVSGVNSLFNTNEQNVSFQNINFTGNGTAGPAFYSSAHGGVLTLVFCLATSFGSGGTDGGGVIDQTNDSEDDYTGILLYFNEITASAQVVAGGSSSAIYTVTGNYFHANVVDFLDTVLGVSPGAIFTGNVFSSSTGSFAVQIADGVSPIFINNTFYNAAGAAIGLDLSAGNYVNIFANNLFYGNHQAIDNIGTVTLATVQIQTNAYGDNSLSNTGWVTTPSDISLSANPFVNASSGNFALNSTSGGGAALAGLALPKIYGSSTANAVNVGAVQNAGGAGGTSVANVGFAY